ncbi:FKBP-type peptidyl-prolyl cis-trans isomerase SlyD [Thorsellia anophelis DSM 18579]|uniref:Peptidyl-prolyl cis-trans isomerase n=1 Tax=Thorsellia anophelis DSM 18579 TaxID=1123402 RepID=A0A1I0DDD0_9GAMM|nr:FKBP-type peptidyl-prolyl cis-trans isomerase SlyD [Thorsellia anophelis DSM 18579]
MKIVKDVVVSLAYIMKNQDGVILDEATIDNPLDYLHGHFNLVDGLENELEGHVVGDKLEVTVTPENGYGEYDDDLVQRVPAEVFGDTEELEVGMRFLADTDQGQIPVEITAIEDGFVVVDANHTLAGQTMHFSVEVLAIREALPEELSHGHAHGAHGHHHD